MHKLDMLLITLQGFAGRLGDRLEDRQEGATAVEYGLLVALIAAIIIATVAVLGTQIRTAFCTIVTNLGGTCP